MATNHAKLPKHIAQMVQKNNLVMAIKTLAQEQDISMTEAKQYIDDYELKIKNNQDKKTQKIAKKQETHQTRNQHKGTIPFTKAKGDLDENGNIAASHRIPVNEARTNKDSTRHSSKFDTINAGLDQHLTDIGYKKPLIPYWVKRALTILVVIITLAILCSVVWQWLH